VDRTPFRPSHTTCCRRSRPSSRRPKLHPRSLQRNGGPRHRRAPAAGVDLSRQRAPLSHGHVLRSGGFDRTGVLVEIALAGSASWIARTARLASGVGPQAQLGEPAGAWRFFNRQNQSTASNMRFGILCQRSQGKRNEAGNALRSTTGSPKAYARSDNQFRNGLLRYCRSTGPAERAAEISDWVVTTF
jgi:hypothetical protein